MKTPYRILFEKILNNNKNYITGKTLNVGSGTKPYRYLNPNMICIDKFDYNPSNSKIDLDIKADITKTFPLKDSSIDSVICTDVLEHITNPQKVIDEIHKTLKPNGNLILSTPFLYKFHPDPKDYRRLTKDGLQLLLANKFKILKFIPIGSKSWLILYILSQQKQIPRFIIKLLYPFINWFSRFEKHKLDWALGFFVVAKKI